jgi:4-hydroxy-tetrahydrodipicolinate synthase
MHAFSGIWVPLVTPFNPVNNNELDLPGLQRLARRLRASGVGGLAVCGSTGEAAALDESEQLAALDAVLDAVPDCPVVMGLAGNNLRSVLTRLRLIERRPIAGVLAPPPYYIRPSQAGVLDYFRTLADEASAPLILYNIPYRTGVGIEFDTFRMLAEHPRIVAVKDCGGDAMLTMRLIAETSLHILAGEDAQLLATLALGGSGGILASAHLRPDLFVQVDALMRAGEIARARQIFYRLLPLIRLLFSEPNPGPLKAALGAIGELSGELRSPMQKASPSLQQSLLVALQELDRI